MSENYKFKTNSFFIQSTFPSSVKVMCVLSVYYVNSMLALNRATFVTLLDNSMQLEFVFRNKL